MVERLRRSSIGIRAPIGGDQERENFEIMPVGVHWPDIDEDLGVVGMLRGRET
jgi:hypothetical protein